MEVFPSETSVESSTVISRDLLDYIEQSCEHDNRQIVINIMGGHNIIAPNAKIAIRSIR